MGEPLIDRLSGQAGAFARELNVRAALANGFSAADVEEDDAVQGTYRVLVPASLSDGQAAACALDGFHAEAQARPAPGEGR